MALTPSGPPLSRDGWERREIIRALAIARPVTAWLAAVPRSFEVHSSFPNAINLVAPGGRFLTLLARGVTDGPFSIRLACDQLSPIRPGSRLIPSSEPAPTRSADAAAVRSWLVFDAGVEPASGQAVGSLRVDWRAAKCWDPKLMRLRTADVAIEPVLARLSGRDTPFVRAFLPPSRSDGHATGRLPARLPFDTSVERHAAEALAALYEGLGGARPRLAAAVQLLLGFGPGLTPAGDDCLVGALAALQMLDDARLCDGDEAAWHEAPAHGGARTTALSAAFLAAAWQGDFAAHWHGLRAALDSGEQPRVTGAVDSILSYGASSGADALVGWVVAVRAHANRGRHRVGPDCAW